MDASGTSYLSSGHHKKNQHRYPSHEQHNSRGQNRGDSSNSPPTRISVPLPSPPQSWTMYFPEPPSEPTPPLPFPRASVPWAPPPAPPPGIMSEEEGKMSFLLILLEDDAAFMENDLHVMRYTLQGLGTAVRTPISIQRHALHILGELEIVDRDLPKLVARLEEISVELGGLGLNDTKQGFENQYVVVDKTLMAADEMRKELRLWADTIYLEACDLAGPVAMGVVGT